MTFKYLFYIPTYQAFKGLPRVSLVFLIQSKDKDGKTLSLLAGTDSPDFISSSFSHLWSFLPQVISVISIILSILLNGEWLI